METGGPESRHWQMRVYTHFASAMRSALSNAPDMSMRRACRASCTKDHECSRSAENVRRTVAWGCTSHGLLPNPQHRTAQAKMDGQLVHVACLQPAVKHIASA